jgi:hypothetical protein
VVLLVVQEAVVAVLEQQLVEVLEILLQQFQAKAIMADQILAALIMVLVLVVVLVPLEVIVLLLLLGMVDLELHQLYQDHL